MCVSFSFPLATEESIKDRTEQEQLEDNRTDDLERNEEPFPDSPRSDEMGKSMRMKRGDSKLSTLSGRMYNCQGKNLRINIPLTTPSRTISAVSYLIWDDLVNQSSKKFPEGSNRLHINKTKLHHAEKMIRGALIELYKGLGYLKTYRYPFQYQIKIITLSKFNLREGFLLFIFFRNLNMLAFIKILKKFDKVS